MTYDWRFIPPYDVTCPKCGEAPSRRCRALTSDRTTDTHQARLRQSLIVRAGKAGVTA